MLQVGIALVGTSSLLGGEGSATHEISPQKMLLGMGLIIASQVGSGTFTHAQTFIHTHGVTGSLHCVAAVKAEYFCTGFVHMQHSVNEL